MIKCIPNKEIPVLLADLVVDRNLPTPVYVQIKNQIRRRINQGILAPGSRLPNARELCGPLGVAYPTLSKAMKMLAEEGLIARTPSAGTFVKPNVRFIKNLAVTYDSMDHTEKEPWLGSILRGISMGVAPSKWHAQLFPLPNASIFGSGEQALLPRLLRDREIDGLIAISPHLPDEIEKVMNIPIPVVTYRNQYPIANTLFVMEDVEQAASGVMDYVAGELQHRKILLVMGHRSRHTKGMARSSTLYAEALLLQFRARNLPCSEETIIYSEFHWKQIKEQVRRSLTSFSHRPTAIITVSDALATETIRLARQLGLDVPRDLSVVGFGDVPRGSDLTTVHVPLEDMGQAAMNLLERSMYGDAEKHLRFSTELTIRSTCGRNSELQGTEK